MSMISKELFEYVHSVIRYTCGHDSIGFGAKNIIVVGDPMQLPAVCTGIPRSLTGRARESAIYERQIFSSPLLDHFNKRILRTSVRQADDREFAEIVNNIRINEKWEEVNEWLERNCVNRYPDKEHSSPPYFRSDKYLSTSTLSSGWLSKKRENSSKPFSVSGYSQEASSLGHPDHFTWNFQSPSSSFLQSKILSTSYSSWSLAANSRASFK
ncbi:hypothetical protein ADUPG1_011413, partial [Aduncisulcus paluster]